MTSNIRIYLSLLLLPAVLIGCGAQAPIANHAVAPQEAASPVPQNIIDSFNDAMNDMSGLKYAQAEQKLQALLPQAEAVGNADFTSELLFWLGYTADKQKRPMAARQYYQRIVREFPRTKAAIQAQQRLKPIAKRF